MIALGLLPPYSLDDVKSAYRLKVLKAHPDRGGSTAEFLKIQEAYEHAVEYVEHCGDRRKWIADHVDAYLRQREAAAEVERLGGQVEFEEVDWLTQSVGDFAVLVERLRAIRLRDTAADDNFLAFLTDGRPRTPYIVELDLSGTRITDKGLRMLESLSLLQRLDLSRTNVTRPAVSALVQELSALEEVDLAGTRVGWLARWRLAASVRSRKAENERRMLLGKLTEAGG
jgi:hypothetical protein